MSPLMTEGTSKPALAPLSLSPKVQTLLSLERQYSAGGFEPAPGFFVSGHGAKLWDVDGKEYIDFISMFSAVNQGHCHASILSAVSAQMRQATLINLATHSASWPPFAAYMCQRFGYAKIMAMTSGSEAADAACKNARKWGIVKKGIRADACLILGVGQGYHGMTSGVWNLTDPNEKREEYGLDSKVQMNTNPTTGEPLTYCDIEPMRRCIEEHHERIAAVIMECFHGRAPAMAEEAAYARAVYDLCRAHNILFIADEVRQGAGKTGRFLSYEHLGADVRPDLVTMGKSITGGFYPASFVLGTAEVMDLVGTGESASTFAANPLAVAAAQAAIAVIDDEGLVERATAIGKRWVEAVESWKHPLVRYVTNRGADSMVVLQGVRSQRVAALALLKGLLVFPRDDYLRISPAMVISDEEIDRAAQIMKETLDEVNEYDEIPGEFWDVTTKTSQV